MTVSSAKTDVGGEARRANGVQAIDVKVDLNPYDHEGNVRPLRDIRDEAICHALVANGGSISRTARDLRIGRSTVYKKFGSSDTAAASQALLRADTRRSPNEAG